MSLLLIGGGCDDTATPSDPKPAPEDPAPKPKPKPTPTPVAADGVARTGKVIEISSKRPVGEVHPGDVLEWPIADSTMSVEARHRTEFGAARLSGTALKQLPNRHKESAMPGDHDVNTYVFVAVAPGEATLRSSATSMDFDNPKPAGSGGGDEDLTIRVVVTAP